MFKSKRILIALVISCSLSGLVCAQSGNQANNEKARYLLDKMLASRKKMKNLQFDVEYTDWRDQDSRNEQYKSILSRFQGKLSEKYIESLKIGMQNETDYRKYSFALDSNDRAIRYTRQKGFIDSSGTRLPIDANITRIYAWDGHTGVTHTHGEKSGSAVLDDSPPHPLQYAQQPWREYTGYFTNYLAEAIEAQVPIDFETMPDGKYRIRFISSRGYETIAVIDPARGYSCALRKTLKDGIERGCYKAEYEEFADGVWFPVSGEMILRTPKGVMDVRSIMKTSNVKVNDPNFNENVFHVDLPKGTRVTNKVQGIRYIVGDPNSVRQSGDKVEGTKENSN